MAVTLLEASRINSGTVKEAAIIEQFPRSSDILRVLPFRTIDGNAFQYTVEDTLPGVAFRGVNEGFPESTGIVNPFTEALKISGGDLDVDKFIIDTQGQEQRSIQELMKAKALALNWTRQFIKGDSRLNPRLFDGLEARIVGSNIIPASGTVDTAGQLNINQLDAALDIVDNPTHLLMNKTMRRELNRFLRKTTIATIEKDEFGNQVSFYNGIPILVADIDDTGAQIMDFNESYGVAGGATTVATSIYVLSIGEGSLMGLQGRASGVAGMSVRDIGELQTKPVVRTRVEWYSAIAVMSGRAAVRIAGITATGGSYVNSTY